MPLDTKDALEFRTLYGLDDAIRGSGNYPESRASIIDRLMVEAVDAERGFGPNMTVGE